MKCDGNLPTCNQCIRFRRTHECEFSETAEPSTTRLLEQHIARLQSRIQELELEQDEPGHIKLHDPYAAPNPPSTIPSQTSIPGKNWWDLPEPPSRVAQTLTQYFLSHAEKLGFFLDPGRFMSSCSSSSPHTRPPYVLRSVIYLWGLRLSRDAQLASLEAAFTTRAMRSVHEALSAAQDQSQNALYLLQAEILLAYYLFTSNRLLEGKLHAGAAVSLAYLCGLHKMPTLGTQQAFGLLPAPTGILPPAPDDVAECEKVDAWWTTFVLDKTWIIALSSPSMVAEQEESTIIDTPWSVPVETYVQQAAVARSNTAIYPGRTVQRFLANVLTDNEASVSHLALLAKAAALYEFTTRVVTRAQHNASGMEPTLAGTDTSIEQFKQLIPPISGRDPQPHHLLLIYGFAHAATIQLHQSFAARSPRAMEKCLGAALSIVRAAQTLGSNALGLTGGRVGIVNPVVGVILVAAGEALVQGLRFMRSSRAQWNANPALPSEDQLVRSLKTLLGLLGSLSAGSPFFESQLTKLNETLSGL